MSNTSDIEIRYIDKPELLYRRISSNKCKRKGNPDHYTVEPSGKIRIISGAFVGGGHILSVERQEIIGKPECIKKEPSEGIISIESVDIEAIKYGGYEAKIKITPLPKNSAHADIVLLPESDQVRKSILRKVRDALARKSTCVIEPNPK